MSRIGFQGASAARTWSSVSSLKRLCVRWACGSFGSTKRRPGSVEYDGLVLGVRRYVCESERDGERPRGDDRPPRGGERACRGERERARAREGE